MNGESWVNDTQQKRRGDEQQRRKPFQYHTAKCFYNLDTHFERACCGTCGWIRNAERRVKSAHRMLGLTQSCSLCDFKLGDSHDFVGQPAAERDARSVVSPFQGSSLKNRLTQGFRPGLSHRAPLGRLVSRPGRRGSGASTDHLCKLKVLFLICKGVAYSGAAVGGDRVAVVNRYRQSPTPTARRAGRAGVTSWCREVGRAGRDRRKVAGCRRRVRGTRRCAR